MRLRFIGILAILIFALVRIGFFHILGQDAVDVVTEFDPAYTHVSPAGDEVVEVQIKVKNTEYGSCNVSSSLLDDRRLCMSGTHYCSEAMKRKPSQHM